jgi:hypothetical protein
VAVVETGCNSDQSDFYVLIILVSAICHPKVGVFLLGLYAGLSVAPGEP